jgi:hypothetical protein
MHSALIFNGAFELSIAMAVFLIRGRQVRKELDEKMQRQSEAPQAILPTDIIPRARDPEEKAV